MSAWLKVIGSHKTPIPVDRCSGYYTDENESVGFRRENRPGIREGDHLFLYGAGGSKRIFALVEAIGNPERDNKYDAKSEGSCRWKLRIQYSTNLPVASGLPIDEVRTKRDLARSISQKSHIKLSPEEYKSVYSSLEEMRTKHRSGNAYQPTSRRLER
jgi:hypothetical protein